MSDDQEVSEKNLWPDNFRLCSIFPANWEPLATLSPAAHQKPLMRLFPHGQ
ncbi:hypothetical protein [Streptomyces sp. SID12501]|uniref:Uncharacterized protein n=1 Tax=Streptomyces sp. SID12501 TaxID=2706042 RepID=A0A6B3BGQ8_9ACTN|nr:hypothetical protein [Streptomyces sp. SID12501]NEC84950.1 hypothetical protein [Streptomyces sp. SID12501]